MCLTYRHIGVLRISLNSCPYCYGTIITGIIINKVLGAGAATMNK